MRKPIKLTLFCIIAAAAITALIWAFLAGKKEQTGEAEREQPIKTASRLVTDGNRVAVRMTPVEQAQNDIAVSGLQPASHRRDVRAPALVLAVQELNDLRAGYVAAKAQMEKAETGLEVSQQEYERLNVLYKQDRNASLKALQAAEGTMRSDRITVKAGRDNLSLVEDDVRQRWGIVVAEWLFAGSSPFQRVVHQQDLLIQVTLPAGIDIIGPTAVRLPLSGKVVSARLVSSFPRLDPRFQTPSYLYIAPGTPDLIPGMNLVALLPSGPMAHGVLIPRSSAVWWQGRAWVYVQTAADEFAQRVVPTDMPVENGWIAAEGFSPGEKVVIRGAQQLLSEIFRSQIQVGEETR